MSRGNDSHSLEVALRPGLVDARRIHDDAVATAIDSFRLDGGGQLSWWVDDPSQADHDLADHHGLSPVRRLLEMRMSLPARDQAEIETRSFVPGNDDLAWIVVNNRAFDGHSEQGAWTTETLQSRIAAPWFDPEGFRLHEQAGRIVGFCWTKVHHLDNTVIGEIYAIGVDPDFRGRRLGQQLTLAGLDSISGRGVHDVKLFVDASNTAALSMYDSLGFTMHSSRDAFAGTI